MDRENLFLNKILDASANTIWDELKKLNESTEEKKKIIRRRWIWELIQNASDCTPEGKNIDITIIYKKDRIIFSHNGLPFSYENLLDLITQISSKQNAEDDKTGKFGTGFMSTHLLSDIVQIKGSFEHEVGRYSNLDFKIDRSGKKYDDIRNITNLMLDELEKLNINNDSLKEEYSDTIFIYDLKENDFDEEIIESLQDLINTIPFVLAFNKNIKSITYNDKTYCRKSETNSNRLDNMQLVEVETTGEIIQLFLLTEDTVSISCIVDIIDEEIYFKPISKSVSKVFCNFPLIGTENFSFPIMVNSNVFDVEKDRDAIRDGSPVNAQLIEKAISLYENLLNYCEINNNINNVFNICMLEPSAVSSNIQSYSYKRIINYIEKSKLVYVRNLTGENKRIAYKNNKGDIQISIPKTKVEENKKMLWQILYFLSNQNIPTENDLEGWTNVFGGNLSFSETNNLFKECDIDYLKEVLSDEKNYLSWLNDFYSLWIADEGIENVVETVLVPNQLGHFERFYNLYFDQDIDENLKGILTSLEVRIEKKLLLKNINSFEQYFEEYPNKVKSNSYCAEQINDKILQLLSRETLDHIERLDSTQKIFNKMTKWFLSNPETSKNIFKELYPKRMMLSSQEENLRRLMITEKLDENNIKTEELDNIINNRHIVNELINNTELSTEDIVEQLRHVITPTFESRLVVEKLINRSVENVFNYLKDLKEYSLPDTLNEWVDKKYSETVFPAKFENKDIFIVIRPGDNQQIIFYYEQELEALDNNNYQLWTDDGVNQSLVTLGDLLKTTGITKIPLRKIRER